MDADFAATRLAYHAARATSVHSLQGTAHTLWPFAPVQQNAPPETQNAPVPASLQSASVSQRNPQLSIAQRVFPLAVRSRQ